MANYRCPLYERSCSVFQRRVKQVYFQLNPFLERTNLKDDEAECYQPSSKFVVPLSSLVVCEKYDSDQAQGWKIFKPEEFWEYLYSDIWSDDCSLRVLEGELLELLKTALRVLEKNEDVTCHSTFAYANNKRKVHKCYVSSLDTKEEFTDETQLVEFIYYGVSEKDSNGKKKEPLVNWKDYKEMASKAAGLNKLVDIVGLVESSKRKKKAGDFTSLIRSPKSTYAVTQSDFKDLRVEALTAMRWVNGFRAMSNSKRRSQPPPIPVSTPIDSPDQHGTMAVDENASTNFDNSGDLLAKMDEILFDRSKRVGRSRRATTFFGSLSCRRTPPGDEYYINKFSPKHTEPFKTVDFLQQLKQEKMVEREKEIEEVKQLTEKMKQNKLENCVDESRQLSDDSYKPFLRLYDKRLSFGDFYRYLHNEPKHDPRFKKGASKKRKMSDAIKARGFRDAVGCKKGSKIIAVVELNKASKKIVTDRQRFANEVKGVTDSEPAKIHCLKNVCSEHKTESQGISKSSSSALRGRRLNSMFSETGPSTTHRRLEEQFYTTLPKITSPIMEGTSPAESASEKRTSLSNVRLRAQHSRDHRKAYSKTAHSVGDSDTDIESSDSPIHDKDDDYEDTVFNSKKLNRKYSIEKMRAMKSKKEKKPPVINILKKFYRMNKVLNTLDQKASKVQRKSLVDANRSKQSAKAFGMFRRLNKEVKEDNKPQTDIGKMKHFEFLKHKDHQLKIPEIVKPDFKTSSIENFKNNLLQAIGSFVIRKEMVTTSHNFETVTTVTFTRPATYARLYQVPED